MNDDQLYVYRVTEIVKIVDGDTFDLVVDPGFRLSYADRFRLFGWDTPEIRAGSEYERAQAQRARRVAAEWISGGAGALMVRTHKADSFGRWLAEVFREDEDWSSPAGSLGLHLQGLSLATEWPTRWRDVFDAGDG